METGKWMKSTIFSTGKYLDKAISIFYIKKSEIIDKRENTYFAADRVRY